VIFGLLKSKSVRQTLPNPPAHDPVPRLTHPAEPARQIADGPCLFRLWHLVSLDAPTVAVVWSLAFASAAGVRLPVCSPFTLALTVWSIYLVDRLFDARHAIRSNCLDRLRERHFFHWRHRRTLLPAAIVSALAAASLVLAFIPPSARIRDSLFAGAVFAYFARIHSGYRSRPFLFRFLSKEVLVGLFFTIGCALPAVRILAATPHARFWPLAAIVPFFALLAWLNCGAIDRWESASLAVKLPLQSAAALIACVGLLSALLLFASQPILAALLAAGAVSALLLALLDLERHRLSPVLLRASADLVLLTPAMLFPIVWCWR
jgi:hypothetical protein